MPALSGAGLSTGPDSPEAARLAARQAAVGLGGAGCDLAVVLVTHEHRDEAEAVLEAIAEELDPEQLVGAVCSGVLGGAHEHERGPGVSVWAVHLGADGAAESFVLRTHETDDGLAVSGVPAPEEDPDTSALLLLVDPHRLPVEPVLSAMAEAYPAVPLVGAQVGIGPADDAPALLHDRELLEAGAVGVRLRGVELLPCVSPAAVPVGPELTVTAAEGGVVLELAGRPALGVLQDTAESLPDAERELLERVPLLGLVVERDKPDYVPGDFVVRGLAGADPETGAVAVGHDAAVGQVARLHVRDADAAGRELRAALALRREALGDSPPAGALMFTCTGRGEGLFGVADHDARAVQEVLGPVPLAGCFVGGEIGPVGGRAFLHAFTASVAVLVG